MQYFITRCLFHYEVSLHAAVDSLIVTAAPSGHIKKLKYPAGFPGNLNPYIKKENYFYKRYKKFKTDIFYVSFSFYRKSVKTTFKIDRSR
jgi:hypothetical protein